MKVWIVLGYHEHSTAWVDGVYDTLEKAEKRKNNLEQRKLGTRLYADWYEIEDWEVK